MDKKIVRKKQKPKKQKNCLVSFLLYFMSFLLVFTISSYFSFKYFIQEEELDVAAIKAGISEETGIKVEIPTGSDTGKIAEILKDAGVIKRPFVFKFISKFNGYDGRYKSGKHIVAKGLEYKEIMEILCAIRLPLQSL